MRPCAIWHEVDWWGINQSIDEFF